MAPLLVRADAVGPVTRSGQRALWLRPFAWMWAKRAWIAALVGVFLAASTLYVLWAIKDLPDPSQNVLAAGECRIRTRGRTVQLVEPEVIVDSDLRELPWLLRPFLAISTG